MKTPELANFSIKFASITCRGNESKPLVRTLPSRGRRNFVPRHFPVACFENGQRMKYQYLHVYLRIQKKRMTRCVVLRGVDLKSIVTGTWNWSTIFGTCPRQSQGRHKFLKSTSQHTTRHPAKAPHLPQKLLPRPPTGLM